MTRGELSFFKGKNEMSRLITCTASEYVYIYVMFYMIYNLVTYF